MQSNRCKIFFLTLLNFLFLTTSLWSIEDDFDVIKKPYKPIVLSDFSNFSWNDVVIDGVAFPQTELLNLKILLLRKKDFFLPREWLISFVGTIFILHI